MSTPKNNSVIKAFEILNAISHNDSGLKPPEVASEVGMTLSTAHRFLLTLEEIGAVIRSAGNRYHLGLMMAELGRNLTRKDALAEIARPIVNQLANRHRETVSLATFDGHQLNFVAWAEPKRLLTMNLRRDHPLPMHCSSIGKVIISGLPIIVREELISTLHLEKFTDNTIVSLIKLRKEISKAYKDGFAIDNQEMEEGLTCLAVPVRGYDGDTIAAISISAPSTRMTAKDREGYIAVLKESAEQISSELFVESKVIPGKAKPRGSYPHLKRVGDLVFVSGTSARKADDSFAGARTTRSGNLILNAYEQTQETIKNLKDILLSVDANLADVIEVEAFLVDMDHYEDFNKAWSEFFDHNGPARTTVAVKALPHPSQLLMIKAVAHIPASRS